METISVTKQHNRTYSAWWSMVDRCTNLANHAYPDYGSRGITVCERWLSFENFLADMGERPEGLTLDRVDNEGNYELSNCKWVTRSEQQRNTRRTKLTQEKVDFIRASDLSHTE